MAFQTQTTYRCKEEFIARTAPTPVHEPAPESATADPSQTTGEEESQTPGAELQATAEDKDGAPSSLAPTPNV